MNWVLKSRHASYRLYSGSDGKSFMVDNNGRSFPVMKKIPRYIKLVN
jgi:hypothetical protein